MFDNTWGSRQWLRLTKEATPGTFDAGASGANIAWVRLGDSAFAMRVAPSIYEIMGAEAGGEAVMADSQITATTGSLKTPMYPSQAGFLLAWAADVVSTGTPAVYSKKTMTCDYFDGVRTRRYLGACVVDAELSASATGGPAMWSLSLAAQKPDSSNPVLAAPALTVFPTDKPYKLQNTSGKLKIGGSTARVGYDSFSVKLSNRIVSSPCEAIYPDLDYCGRSTSYKARLKYKTGEVDRAAWEGVTALANNEIEFARAGSHTVKISCNGAGYFSNYTNSYPLQGISMVDLEVKALFDPAATTPGSFVYEVTAP